MIFVFLNKNHLWRNILENDHKIYIYFAVFLTQHCIQYTENDSINRGWG